MRRIASLAIPLMLAGALAARAADTPPAKAYEDAVKRLDAFIQHEVETKNLPALSIALVDDQKVVWARGYGFADPQAKTPATSDTVYRVGSVSKLFTDLAVMQLVERGALDLDAPITRVLPDFKPVNRFDTPITLRQLDVPPGRPGARAAHRQLFRPRRAVAGTHREEPQRDRAGLRPGKPSQIQQRRPRRGRLRAGADAGASLPALRLPDDPRPAGHEAQQPGGRPRGDEGPGEGRDVDLRRPRVPGADVHARREPGRRPLHHGQRPVALPVHAVRRRQGGRQRDREAGNAGTNVEAAIRQARRRTRLRPRLHGEQSRRPPPRRPRRRGLRLRHGIGRAARRQARRRRGNVARLRQRRHLAHCRCRIAANAGGQAG